MLTNTATFHIAYAVGFFFSEIIYAGEIDARMHTSSSDVEHLRRFSHSKKIEEGFCDVPTPPRMWRLRRLRRNLLEGHLANTMTVGEMTKWALLDAFIRFFFVEFMCCIYLYIYTIKYIIISSCR